MSSSVVATVAWLALAGTVLLGAGAGWLYYRLVVLGRALTDSKWEIVVLRAEVGALRREVRGTTYPAPEPVSGNGSSSGARSVSGAGPSAGAGSVSGAGPSSGAGSAPGDGSGDGADGGPVDDGARNGRGRPSSPTAWRRDRARRIAHPRRRRPG